MGTTTVDFGDVETKLRAYLKATGIPMSKCIRRAVLEHIDAELAMNPGVKARFDDAIATVAAHASGNVAPFIARRRPRKPTAAG